ncbi:MAG: DNA primase [Ignavibacteriae bacterium HGW-Ignavibacteriae-3]|nr:MAG: DNA primase [Ignavibacteriae bacterium HGW-Ignavibacteriae-3]
MRIPEHKIDEVRNAADIVDVISAHVHLKKRGKNFIGLCPFHQEKTPSFTVSEDKQIYHCFGCGVGGNVFKFLMEFKNISFVEAVEEIADHLGIKIEAESAQSDEKQSELEELYELNIVAARFFSDHLLKSVNGEAAREYLKRRNIKVQSQKIFGIGYAPNGWDNFLAHAKENKADLGKAKILGLIDTNDKGEYYDKYRDRIIFPIFSPNGRVIAFGGRVLEDSEKAAKYLNSPESMIYSKRRSLYGLFHSKDDIRKLDRAILVEGYMDLVSLYQAGVKNVVASSGTSLTEEQVQLLSRFTKNIIILFDADPAGQKAALRSIEILLRQDFEVKVITLPKGEDPDSFIIKFGKEKFEEEILKGKNFLEYQTAQFEEQGLFEDSADMTKAIRELVKTLSLVSDELKRNLLMKTIAKRFNLREKLIESELNAFLNQQQNRSGIIGDRPDKRIVEQRSASQLALSPKTENENPYEKELLRLLYSGDKEVISHILSSLSLENFSNHKLRKLAEIVYNGYEEEKFSPADLIDKIPEEEARDFIFDLTLSDESISKKWDELSYSGKIDKDTLEHAAEIVRNFHLFQIDQQIKLNNKFISDSKDERLHLEMMKRNKELYEEKKSLLEIKPKNKFD